MSDVVGSIRGFSVDGIPFRVAGDANFSRKPTNVENTAVPTSGNAMMKKTKIVPTLEGATLIVNTNELAALKNFSESLDKFTIGYQNAAGDRFRCIGQIQIDSHESEEGRAAVIVLPEGDWTPFPV